MNQEEHKRPNTLDEPEKEPFINIVFNYIIAILFFLFIGLLVYLFIMTIYLKIHNQ